MIEVNAETDFVAKNTDFQNFVKTCADTILEKNPADMDALMKTVANGTDMTVEALVQDKVLTIGENIKIRRFERYEGVVATYIHAAGRIGVMVKFDTTDEIAAKPEFKAYAKQVIANCAVLSNTLKEEGFRIVSGGTDNHLILVDVKSSLDMSGKLAEKLLDEAGITCNKNTIPFETEKPFVTSGIRLGTAAMTTRGFKENEFRQVALWISRVLKNAEDEKVRDEVRNEVRALTVQFPLPNEG